MMDEMSRRIKEMELKEKIAALDRHQQGNVNTQI